MAVYEFECKACGKHFEVTVPISEHDRLKKRPPKCRKCGTKQVLIRTVGEGSQFHTSDSPCRLAAYGRPVSGGKTGAERSIGCQRGCQTGGT